MISPKRNRPTRLYRVFITLLFMTTALTAATQPIAWEGSARIWGSVSLIEATDSQLIIQPQSVSGSGHLALDYKDKPLDFSSNVFISIEAHNQTAGKLDVTINALSDPGQQWSNRMTGRFILKPDEQRSLSVFMLREALEDNSPWIKKLGNLYAFPSGYQRHWRNLKTDSIRRVTIDFQWENASGSNSTIIIEKPKGTGKLDLSTTKLADIPNPMVDALGQLVAETWEGKIHEPDELTREGQADIKNFTNHPVGSARSTYGGLLNGPKLEATGKFRTAKLKGKWWLVDPDGYLFWSIGVTEAGIGSLTRTEGRKYLFPKLRPRKDSDVWKLDRDTLAYNFYHSNLKLKYGDDWLNKHHAVTEGRMRAWGINTVGAWSMEPGTVFKSMRPTVPYTVIVHTNLNGGLGRLKHMIDPFSDQFQKSLENVLASTSSTYANDPNNLGVFVNNELDWEGGIGLPLVVMELENHIPAKLAMLRMLKEHYDGIAALNQAWGTSYSKFEDIRMQNGLTDNPRFVSDMQNYYTHFAEAFFSKAAQAVQKHYPGHLFLGCRFNKWSDIVTRAASRYCDVISFNLYQNSVADFTAETSSDRPFLISEFHFGSGSHGVWGRGLTPCADADNQAELYRAYVNDALQHPQFVGAHWFTWADQPVTGRYDGENFRVGLVNIVDKPYGSLVNTMTEVAQKHYPRRLDKVQKTPPTTER